MTTQTNGIPSISSGEFRMVRQLLNDTQETFGKRLGLSKRTIEEYEAGRREIPIYIRDALHLACMKAALERRNPRLATEATGQLAEKLADLRAEVHFGDQVNGWAFAVADRQAEGASVTYAWAVAVDDMTAASAVLSRRTPAPPTGFRPLARLSQFTIARLRLREGDACPL